jgi:hypothetical protein
MSLVFTRLHSIISQKIKLIIPLVGFPSNHLAYVKLRLKYIKTALFLQRPKQVKQCLTGYIYIYNFICGSSICKIGCIFTL